MANKLKDEDLVLNVIVNGNEGKKALGDLSRFIKDTTREVTKLEAQESKLRASGKKDTEAYREVTSAIRQKNEAIQQARDKMVRLVATMDVMKMSSADLKASQIALKKAMDNSVPGSERWNAFKIKLDAVGNRIKDLESESAQTGSALERMGTKFNKFIGMITAGIASLFATLSGAISAVNAYAALDDTMGGVQKTTGLAKEEVKALNAELNKMETRTTQEDLLGLGRIGGKLGVGDLEDLEGFVRATDQIVVALNEDLGGDVEETVNQVGKLVDIFKLKDDFGLEKSLIKTGSAINDLGAAGTANEGYIVDFSQRVAGIAPTADISLQNVLGLAATLDTLGQSAEVSGTAYANIIPDMFRNTGTYAKVAGMDLKAFTSLLEKDANEAFIKVLEGIKGNNSGMAEMVTRLDELGVDGARSVSVLGALANNTGLLRQQQELSNQSFAAGTSIGKEYNTMNSTAQAELDKSKKVLHQYVVELGERLYPAMTGANTLIAFFVRILSTMAGFLFNNGRAILTVAAAVVAYNAVIFLSTALTKQGIIARTAELALSKLKVFWDGAMTGSMHLLSAAYALSRGQIAAAKAEMIAFNLVTKMNPIGILIAVLAAGVIALSLYSKKLSETEKMQRAFNDVQSEAQKSVMEEKNRIKTLTDIIDSEVIKRQDKLAAIKKLKEMMPDHLKGYSEEEILAGKATVAIRKYIGSLESRARADAAIKKLTSLDEENQDLTKKGKDGFDSLDFIDRSKFQLTRGKSGDFARQEYYKEILERKKEIDQEKEAIRKRFAQDLLTQSTEPTTTSTITYAGGESDKERKEREKAEKKARADAEASRRADIDSENRSYQERLKSADLFGKNKANMTSEELEKLAVLEQEHLAKIESINQKSDKFQKEQTSSALAELEKRQTAQKKYRDSLINPLNEEIAQEEEANRMRIEKAGLTNLSLADLQSQLLAATKSNNQKEVELLQEKIRTIEILEGIHQAKLNQIDAKSMKEGIEKKQQAYDTELADLRIRNKVELSEVTTLSEAKALLEESMNPRTLAGITNLNQAKKAIQQKNQAEETELTKQHLEALLKQLQDSMSSGEFEGLNLSDKILSKEEKEILEKKILDVKTLLAGLKNPAGDPDGDARQKDLEKLDILGFSGADWEQMFQNLADGKLGVDDLAGAAHGLVNAWSTYNQFVAAGEKKQLQEFESATNKKKASLKKQLDSGQINQEKYNAEIEKMDAALDQKKAEMDYKAAKREKAIALMNAVVNTAAAVAKALPNIALSIIAGAIGALQIGTIMKTPLPEVPGREDGGPFDNDPPYMTVRRSQDGRKFRAKNDPDKRGFIDKPTVLVGESGNEFVVNNAGVSNPSIAPVLSAIDTAQKNGTISTLRLEEIMYRRQLSTRVSGRASGGSFSDGSHSTKTNDVVYGDPVLVDFLQKNIEATTKLNRRLDEPIVAEVALLGKNGFNERQKELTDLESKNTL